MRKPCTLIWLAFGMGGVLSLHALEARWPQMSWLIFFLLTLSLGFAHGVLDVILLRHALPQARLMVHASLYGITVLMVLAVAWLWPAAALLGLLVISVWHFGQELHPQRAARVALGGTAVMWPMLLQPAMMQSLLTQAFPQDAWLMLAWQAFAWGWLLGLIAVVIHSWVDRSIRHRLLIESGALALLYSLLSPWLAFAVYFSLFHSVTHMRRVWLASAAQGVSWQQHRMALVITAGSTLVLIGLSASLVSRPTEWLMLFHSAWALPAWVALVTAVTVPHGFLVGHSWSWLMWQERET